MRRKNHTHQQDIDDLKKQNALLEQQGTWTNGFICVFMRQYSTGSNVSFCLWLLQFGHWRRRRGTLSSRRTTLLTAACTQTGKAARCRPSTAAPTPALNQSRMSLPTERSCAWSPARPGSFPRVLQTDSFCPPAPTPLTCPHCPAFKRQSRGRGGDCVRAVLLCIKRFYLPFPPGKHPVTPFRGPATTFKSQK